MASASDEDFQSEEDFWNSSSLQVYNFNDDEKSDSESEDFYQLPSFISKDSLNILLEETTSAVSPPVEETIKKLFFGQKYVLNVYQRLDEKLKLLDSAIEISDGNIIICVIVFLRKTIKTNIFFIQIAKRKIAVRHYSNYLISKGNWQELADLYMATGSTSNMKNLYYLLCKETTSKQSLLKKLDQLIINHYQNSSSEDKAEVNENLEFLKWQIANSQSRESVIEQLAIVCKSDYEKNRNDEATIELKKSFKIDDFQYEWTLLNVLAGLQLWEKLKSNFLKPNWLTKKITLKSVIRADLFLVGLSKHQPPNAVLEEFLQCVSDSELNFNLAQKLNLHKSVIRHFISQRDRISLLRYKERVQPQSEEYLLIEKTLHLTDKKWKN